MSGTPKKISEEELEKQYEDYRTQFEQWKENNKSSIGTDAYNSYVNQFEQWEKEVEARKAQQRNQKRVVGHSMDEKEKEAAAAYAISQESYVQHHMKAMVEAEMQQRAAAAAAQHHHQQHFIEAQASRQAAAVSSSIFASDVVSGIAVAPSGNLNHGVQSAATPPNLWGNPKPAYDARDPLFAKWGERAATAHTKTDNDVQKNPVACWMLLETLRERKMVLAPHSNNVPPPLITSQSHA